MIAFRLSEISAYINGITLPPEIKTAAVYNSVPGKCRLRFESGILPSKV